ncbi:MAG TPA: sulfotransferase [Solirubrobacteraceae bacterium]|nr:sulfotransferase [Solirubrobacteraceae bacterium]
MTGSTDPPRTPDFFVVGHPKSGTTALYEMLRRHPQIFMPELKEPRFLASDMYFRTGGTDTSPLPGTLEEYLALFAEAPPEQRAGEASPLYLASELAAADIAQLRPDARIVAVLREPASFLRSLHLQFVQSHIEDTNDLAKAIALEQARREGREIPRSSQLRPQVLQYARHVRYVEQLRRYHAVFPRERVLVLIYDDFRADNDATVKKVLSFLEVDDIAIEALDANPSVRVRSQRLDGLLHAVSVGHGPRSRATKTVVKALAPRSVRRRALGAAQRRVVYARPREPDAALTARLRRRFKGEVQALSEYLGRDLVAQWGYDAVD